MPLLPPKGKATAKVITPYHLESVDESRCVGPAHPPPPV